MKVLIVDDEKLARERLRGLLEESQEDLQISLAENGLACIDLARQHEFDVALLDIRMPGMDGLETADHLSKLATPPAIVFTTAFDDRAIDAFNANAVDYLLKPIRRERLLDALKKAGLLQKARLLELRNTLSEREKARTHLSASNKGKIELIPIDEIRYLRADSKYVAVGWQGHETLIDEALKSLETEFHDRFVRVHRNALVAKTFIDSLERDSSGKVQLHMRGVEVTIDVSRRHLNAVKKVIKQIAS